MTNLNSAQAVRDTVITNIAPKDIKKLIDIPNQLLGDYHARVALYDMPDSILDFFEQNKAQINGEVVIVRSKEDEGFAANKRNSCNKVLFVFSVNYWVTSYFSGVCEKITFPKALIKRINSGKAW